MRFNMWVAGLLLGTACLAPSLSHAGVEKAAIKADNKAEFADVVAAVKGEMVPGGRYEFVSSTERKTIDTNLAEMQSLFDKFETVAAMDKEAKFQLYVDQENVNAILTHRDDRRLICQSERPIGSLIPKRTCRTYGAIEHGRQNAQQEMMRSARPGFIGYDANPSAAQTRTVLGPGQH